MPLKKFFLKLGYFTVLSLPIFLFLHKFVLHTNGILPGDWDYFAQLYEAARRSIVEFHQFPWWNPWMSGGVPLYANPQFGLLSIQMPFVIIFGTLAGLHIAILFYFLLGFWGMLKLLLRLKTNTYIGILLSYIWIFSSFPAWHMAGGHLTFGTYLLAPWFFYFLLNIRKPKGWLWFGLFTAFLINQSLHYMTVHILVLGAVAFIYQIFILNKKHVLSVREQLKPYLLSAVIVLPLIIHKIYYTLQYIHDYPRIPPLETSTPINMITAALTFRGSKVIDPIATQFGSYGWSEYAAYFGLLSLGLLAYLVIKNHEDLKFSKPQDTVLLTGLIIIFVIALGNFSVISPYAIMKHLPIFNQMQVAPRWLGWFVFGAILYLAKLPGKKIFIIILIISVVDVFQSNYRVINYDLGTYKTPYTKSLVLKQSAFVANGHVGSPVNQRFLHATQSNEGDIFGYEPIVGFGGDINEAYSTLSSRCAKNRTVCNFVITNNAVVTYWSPNRIELKRTGNGDIKINENPGAYWLINGRRAFKPMRVLELKQNFVISDPSEYITLKIDPSFSYQ